MTLTFDEPHIQEFVDKVYFTCCKRSLIIIFALFYLGDMAWDIYTCVSYAQQGDTKYSILTFLSFLIPSIITTLVYCYHKTRGGREPFYTEDAGRDGDHTQKGKIKKFQYIVFFLQFTRILSYIDEFKSGMKVSSGKFFEPNGHLAKELQDYLKQTWLTSKLGFIESYLESTSQLLLQLYIVSKNIEGAQTFQWGKIAFSFVSLGLVSFSLLTYQKDSRKRANGPFNSEFNYVKRLRKIRWRIAFFMLCWIFLLQVSRLETLVLFASVFPTRIFYFFLIHWFLAFLWLLYEGEYSNLKNSINAAKKGISVVVYEYFENKNCRIHLKRLRHTDKEESRDFPWLFDFLRINEIFIGVYKYAENNPFLNDPSPFEQGKTAMNLGKVQDAVLLFEATVQNEPDKLEAWQHLVRAQVKGKNDAAVFAALKKCLMLSPESQQNLTFLISLLDEDFKNTLQHPVSVYLGIWLKRKGKYDLKAFEHMELTVNNNLYLLSRNIFRALYIWDENPWLYELMLNCKPFIKDNGVLPLDKRQFKHPEPFEEAKRLLHAAVQEDPTNVQAWQTVAVEYFMNSKEQFALVAWLKCLELRPDNLLFLFFLAVTFTSCHSGRKQKEEISAWINERIKYDNLNVKKSQMLWLPLNAAVLYVRSSWDSLFKHAFMAYCSIFIYFFPHESPSRFRMGLYYIICAVENAVFLSLWWHYTNYSEHHRIIAIAFHCATFIVGLLLMMIYYKRCHPNKKNIRPLRRSLSCCDKEANDSSTSNNLHGSEPLFSMEIPVSQFDKSLRPNEISDRTAGGGNSGNLSEDLETTEGNPFLPENEDSFPADSATSTTEGNSRTVQVELHAEDPNQ